MIMPWLVLMQVRKGGFFRQILWKALWGIHNPGIATLM